MEYSTHTCGLCFTTTWNALSPNTRVCYIDDHRLLDHYDSPWLFVFHNLCSPSLRYSTRSRYKRWSKYSVKTIFRMEKTYIVDFEAFQHGSEDFRLKELCIIDVDKPLQPLYFIFKHRKQWDHLKSEHQKTYTYQMHHLHKLKYEEGHTFYCRTCIWRKIRDVFPSCTNGIFYVYGQQKVHFLSAEFPKVVWRHYDFVPRYADLLMLPYQNVVCIHRPHGQRCACLKVYRLYNDYVSRLV